MPDVEQKISRANFLKLGVAGLSAAALLFVAGCGGEEEEEEDDDD